MLHIPACRESFGVAPLHNLGADSRREQYLLLEQATEVMAQAQEIMAGPQLSMQCWNALIACAARCGQLQRALEWHGNLQNQGLKV